MNIPQVKLLKGSHSETGQTGQGCFMNVIAYLNGEPIITDESDCVCFVMRPLAIWANDWMTDAERNQLLPFILRAMGSRTTDKTEVSRRLALVVAFANEMSEYAAKYAEYAAKYAKYAAESAAKYAAKYAAKSAANAADAAKYAKYAAESAAESAAKYAAKYAAKSAANAADAAKYAKSAAKSAANAAEYAAESAAKSAAKYAEYAAEYAAKSASRNKIITSLLVLFDAALPPLERIDETTVQRIRQLEAFAA